jgi:hypothetical protein
MKAVLVGTTDVEDWSAKRFQRCSILKDEIHVISKETYQAKCKHNCNDEQEKQMKLASTRPELTLGIKRIDLCEKLE